MQERDAEIASLKSDINKLLGERNKNEKIIEMLQGDLNKAKEENTDKAKNIGEKEAKEEELR